MFCDNIVFGVRFRRAEWRALRDFALIGPLADDCLEEVARLQDSTPDQYARGHNLDP